MTVAELWLDLLGQLAAPAAHALNNALNNVAINLAVIQSRPDAKAYAEKADEYLTEATRITRSVMALARPVPVPVDPASVVHQLVPVFEALGHRITVVDNHVGRTVTTTIDGATVRLALAAALVELPVTTVHVQGGQIRVEGAVLKDDVADAARRAGVGLRVEPGQVTFTFS